MFDLRFLVLTIVVASLLANSSSRSFELEEMVNKTVCAIRVIFDKDINRIPYKIKTIKCASHTDKYCVANNIDNSKCCNRVNSMECVEMTDTVLVYNKTAEATHSIEVSVGCACIIQGENIAKDVNSMPTSR